MMLRGRILWACAIAAFVIAVASTLLSLTVHIHSAGRAHPPQRGFRDASTKKDGRPHIQGGNPRWQAFKWLEHQIPTQDMKAALHEMFRLERAGVPQPTVTKTSGSLCALDASALVGLIRARISAFAGEELHFVFDGPETDSSIFFIDGWRCDSNHSTFYKTFTIDSQRKYKFEGRFLESPKGGWRAEGTRLVRLVTLEERARMKRPETDLGMELIPTAQEARIALLNWWETGGLVGWIQNWNSPPGTPWRGSANAKILCDGIEQVMGSRETRDVLANGKILRQQNLLVRGRDSGDARGSNVSVETIHFEHFEIDGWEVFVDDLVFVKMIPLNRIGRVSHALEGGFELTTDGKWKANPLDFRPTMK